MDAGEAWRARRKLRTWLAQFPFDSRFAQMLGELQLLAGEEPAAGRWLWLAGSQDAAHRPVIERFLAEASREELWNAVPRSLRTADGSSVPRAVEEELLRRGVPVERLRREAVRAGACRETPRVSRLLGLLLFAGVLALWSLGLWKAVELVGQWFG